jgi:hypothetical protein
MKTVVAALIAILVLECCSPKKILAATNPSPIDLTGIYALEHLENLPYLRDGVLVKQSSSHDRTGLNGDSNQYLYVDNGKYVIFDEYGPGVIYQFWHTQATFPGTIGNIEFYFEDESTPRIDMDIKGFLGGTFSPYLNPLVESSSYSRMGGQDSYLPIVFNKRLKVEMTTLPSYYHITYHLFSGDQRVQTFSGKEDLSKVDQIWNDVGQDPKDITGNVTASKIVSIPNGTAQPILDVIGAGAIQSVKIGLVPNDQNTLDHVWLSFFWDQQTTASVNVPIGPFFGSYLGAQNIKSLMFGMSSTGLYYSYFPMPYWSRAQVVINNQSGATITLEYQIQTNPKVYGDHAGYFRAKFRSASPEEGAGDYVFLDTTGHGQLVGISTSYQFPSPIVLEGDERVYVDGNLTPALYGTGTEDYFGGGWYFRNGNVSFPSHGAPLLTPTSVVAYRLQLGDMIPYQTSLIFGMEHGGKDDVNNTNYYSVAYYYQKDTPGMIQTDALDVGDAASETRHDYAVSDKTWQTVGNYAYEGVNDTATISDSGDGEKGYSQFSVSISPNNNGVRLRRRLDYSYPNQKADVYVDSSFVGTWYSAGSNSMLRWRDEDFSIPASFTFGKSRITIRIVNTNIQTDWTEFYYWIFSMASGVKPP